MIAGKTPNVPWLIGVWLLGGLFSLIGALCYAELGTAYPKEGGDYVYLTRAFGRAVGFLFGWCQLWIIRPGSIGRDGLRLRRVCQPGLAEGRRSARHLRVGGLRGRVGGRAFGGPSLGRSGRKMDAERLDRGEGGRPGGDRAGRIRLHGAAHGAAPVKLRRDARGRNVLDVSVGRLLLAMIFVLFAFGGWNEMAYVGAEVKEPRKNILRALLIGTVAVTAIYVLVNLAFVHALGLAGARHKTVAADVLRLAIGDWAGTAISLLICISALGAINGQIFTGARIYYAMGVDHRLYAWLGRWNARRGTPDLLAVGSRGDHTCADRVVRPQRAKRLREDGHLHHAGLLVLSALVGLSLMVLPSASPTARAFIASWAIPVTPFLFCLGCEFMVYSGLAYAIENRSWEAFWSIAVLLVGAVLSLFSRD